MSVRNTGAGKPGAKVKKRLNRALHCTVCSMAILATPEVVGRHYFSSHQIYLDEDSIALLLKLSTRSSKIGRARKSASARKPHSVATLEKHGEKQKTKGRKASGASEGKVRDRSRSKDIMDRGRRLSGSYGHGKR